MDNIIGYRKHTESIVEAVNTNKKLENELGDLIKKIRNDQNLDVDQRWVSIAITHFQEGFMALNRSIFKPQSNL